MSTTQPYDELGRVIANGGIRSAGWGIRNIGVGILLGNWLSRRFPSLSRAQAGSLATLGRAFVGAGQGIGALPPGIMVDPATIPLIPEGASGQNAGSRFWSDVRITWRNTLTGRNRTLTIGVGTDQPPTLSEIASAAETTTREDLSQYPGGQPWADPLQSIVLSIEVVGALRQW